MVPAHAVVVCQYEFLAVSDNVPVLLDTVGVQDVEVRLVVEVLLLRASGGEDGELRLLQRAKQGEASRGAKRRVRTI